MANSLKNKSSATNSPTKVTNIASHDSQYKSTTLNNS